MTGKTVRILRFHTTPETGDPDCICSLCREEIPEGRVPIMGFIDGGHGGGIRFHHDCFTQVFEIREGPLVARVPIEYQWGDDENGDLLPELWECSQCHCISEITRERRLREGISCTFLDCKGAMTFNRIKQPGDPEFPKARKGKLPDGVRPPVHKIPEF